MKKVAKAILLALGFVLLAGAAVVLCVNLYIQSADTRARIENALSKAARMPVKIASASYMPWTGLVLTGITTRGVASPDNGMPLEIARVKARVRLWKLLRRKVIVKELTIDGAKVTWNQNDQGTWSLPQQTPSQEPTVQATPPAETPPQVQPEASAAPLPAEQTQTAEPSPPEVMLNHFRLRDATFDFFDSKHRHIVSTEGIRVDSPYPTKESVNGTASISRVIIQDRFFMRDWIANFAWSPKNLSLFNARASIADGVSTGTLNVKISEPDSPFDLDIIFSDINVERLISEAGLAVVQASGSLGGSLRLHGNIRDSNAASGNGRFAITNGRIMQWDQLRMLGEILHSDRLQQIDLKEASAVFHIGGGTVFLDRLTLASPDLLLTCQGTEEISSGTLALKSRLTINESVSRRIPDFLLEGFAKDATTNARYLDFDINGTISSPRSNFLKLAGNGMDYRKIEKGAGNILKNLFKGALKKTPAPAPEIPEASPAPTMAAPLPTP